MYHLTPTVIQEITGGEVRGELPECELSAIVKDSRDVIPGCLFAAIKGASFDGNDFVSVAGNAGAVCALCTRYTECDTPQILVSDTALALRKIATFYRMQFDIPFVGVTGSVGKTTAKEMIASVLSEHYRTLWTEKNFNNELGVPLTLFRLTREHEAAVLEMGISGFGEMTRLGNMVRPDIAAYTLIGDAHLEYLGDRQGVLCAKGELVACMPENGVVIANGDDELLRGHDFGRRCVLFGKGENCHIRATDIKNDGLSGIDCIVTAGSRRLFVHIPEIGAHLVYAALIATAVGIELGLSDEEIVRGIAAYKTVGSRGRIVHCGDITVLDDCYNANPTSMKSALDTLAGLPGNHVAVLGDMLELGEKSPELHRQVGEYAVALGMRVIACGEFAPYMAGKGGICYPDTESLLSELKELIHPGDSVLFKASHGMHFENLVAALERESK